MAASSPEFRQSYCEKCGEATIMECPSCESAIRGHYHTPGVIGFFDYDVPHFCHNCGEAFPWTKRALEAASELALEDGSLSENESAEFAEKLEDIVRETPKAKASANRVKRLLSKMASGTASAVRDIIVDIASESAKKMIWPDS
jgi:hypothetical protein